MGPALCSAILPITWAPPLMRYCENVDLLRKNLVHDRVRKMPEMVAACPVLVFGPVASCGGKSVDSIKQLGAECICSQGTSVEVPQECLTGLCLRLGQNFDVEGIQSEARRCRTSDHGAVCTCPARSSARRRFTSARHCCEMVASSAISRLSRRATANAERSSTGRSRILSRKWSTRAFMNISLAPQVLRRKGPQDAIAADTGTLKGAWTVGTE